MKKTVTDSQLVRYVPSRFGFDEAAASRDQAAQQEESMGKTEDPAGQN